MGNTTDPDSRLQKTSDGAFIQGYNAQAVVSGDQIVVGTAVTPEATDVAMLEPMITNASDNLAAAGSQEPIGAVLADAGYWSHANSLIEDTLDGTLLLIAPGDKTHKVGDPAPAAVRHRHRRHPSPPSHANPTRRPRQPRHLPAAGMANRRHLRSHQNPPPRQQVLPPRARRLPSRMDPDPPRREHHQDPPSRPPPA